MATSKIARQQALAKGHQPGMFKRLYINGKWHNRTYCLHGCKAFLEDGAAGVYGTMLSKKCEGKRQ